MRTQLFAVFMLFWGVAALGAENHWYMGQEPPGLVPQVFAPGLISVADRHENNICFSPDGKECFFTVRTANWSSSWIMRTEYRDGAWTIPERASFTNNRSLGTSISPDGTQLFFSSNRGTTGKQGIWRCTRHADGSWSDPVEMGREISSTKNEWSCHLSDLGNMFLCSWRGGGRGGCDGWRVPAVEGVFQEAVNLRIMNTGSGDCGVMPAPQEEYVLFQSNRSGGYGIADLYISFSQPEGAWSVPRNLGPVINSAKSDTEPWISFDGRYLFFPSNRAGATDIYWVETRAFLPDPNGPVKNLTTGQRFGSIQSAIGFAQNGERIEIGPGIYHEALDLSGKQISLLSQDPNDPVTVGGTIIQGLPDLPVLTLQGNAAVCEIAGLTLRAGSIGVVGEHTQALFRHCRIMDNHLHGLELSGARPTLEHCLITGNGGHGLLMHATQGTGRNKKLIPSAPTLDHCIVVGNGAAALAGGEPIIIDSIIDDGISVGEITPAAPEIVEIPVPSCNDSVGGSTCCPCGGL